MPRTKTDYTDKRFGRLVVKKIVGKDKHGRTLWGCLCDCGNYRELTSPCFKNMVSCGCFKKVNLVGQRFKKLLVLSETKNKQGAKAWLCECDCGLTHVATTSSLNNGLVQSCGCLKEVNKRIDLTGHVFERLSVIRKLDEVSKNNCNMYLCQCECGHLVHVVDHDLLNGKNKSCGCRIRDLGRKQLTTHGLRHHYLYNTWKRMNDRCNNPSDPRYDRYHNKLGVRVCERWHRNNPDGLKNFIEDIEAHLGPRPDGFYVSGRPKYTLDRIKNFQGHYEISNVRWATTSEQNLNKSLEVI